ncbi:hypothetical protein COU37_05920 [Candidatus Micrarchaeota archaeon CG10_big_fil_rev_8_21_14_0_10_45_29]|nr:MAG: hypothetical protein COU37_05920 [Candidatus Micrarchaeota archaeon CG10_big_fil_rev_8_21_14_0_10_45_29]
MLFLQGCVGSGAAGRCAEFSDSLQKGECLKYMAVWYQDPYTCYDIGDKFTREECLEQAIDPKEAKRLQTKSVEVEGPPIIIEEKQNTVLEEEDAVSKCMNEKVMGRDACVREIALAQGDLLMCDEIGAAELRRSCVSNIAISKKDMQKCEKLLRNDDVQLCKYYSG